MQTKHRESTSRGFLRHGARRIAATKRSRCSGQEVQGVDLPDGAFAHSVVVLLQQLSRKNSCVVVVEQSESVKQLDVRSSRDRRILDKRFDKSDDEIKASEVLSNGKNKSTNRYSSNFAMLSG